MAKYNVHAGHNPANMIACGAVGLLNESVENRKIATEVIRLLKLNGHTVYNCTCNNGTSVDNVLTKIVTKCNKHSVSQDHSIHLNSGVSDKKGNGETTGVEVLIYDENDEATVAVAKRICKNIAALGFKNRGVKERPDLYVLRKTNSKAYLTEVCFVDDKDDYKLYQKVGYEAIAEAMVKGILNKNTIKTNDFEPYQVKVTSKTLNVRSGAGTSNKVVGVITWNEELIKKNPNYYFSKTAYTIIEEKTVGSNKWGRLKSGAGWISLGYTKKV